MWSDSGGLWGVSNFVPPSSSGFYLFLVLISSITKPLSGLGILYSCLFGLKQPWCCTNPDTSVLATSGVPKRFCLLEYTECRREQEAHRTARSCSRPRECAVSEAKAETTVPGYVLDCQPWVEKMPHVTILQCQKTEGGDLRVHSIESLL